MTSLLPTVVTPDDVRAFKARLDGFARSLDRSVSMCTRVHPYVRTSWAEFYRGWRQFADADPSWLHAAAEYDAARQYEEHLIAWQTQLAPVCAIAGAPLTRPKVTGSPGSSLENTIKTVAIAGAVVAVALAIREVTR